MCVRSGPSGTKKFQTTRQGGWLGVKRCETVCPRYTSTGGLGSRQCRHGSSRPAITARCRLWRKFVPRLEKRGARRRSHGI